MSKWKLFLAVFVFFQFFLSPAPAHAQTCADQDGHCSPFDCQYGDPLEQFDCTPIITRCCPNEWVGPSCDSLNGHCTLGAVDCHYGSSLGQLDCHSGFKCCPNNPDAVSTDEPWCGAGPGHGVSTALGCLNTSDLNVFFSDILRWATGLASFAAIIAIAYAGFLILSSSGDPKRVKAGQELLIAALEGVVLIALAVVALNFVGINILNLGGLGFQ